MSDNSATMVMNALAAPRKVKADGVEFEQHPLPDPIAAATYLNGKAATRELLRVNPPRELRRESSGPPAAAP